MKKFNAGIIVLTVLLSTQLMAADVNVSIQDCAESPSYQVLSDKYAQQMQAAKLVRNNTLFLQAKINHTTAQAHADACRQLQKRAALSTSTRTQ